MGVFDSNALKRPGCTNHEHIAFLRLTGLRVECCRVATRLHINSYCITTQIMLWM